jgi:hypothetical protein
MKRGKIWYVIADGGRARFVERDDGGAFRQRSCTSARTILVSTVRRAPRRAIRRRAMRSSRAAICTRRPKRNSSSSWPTNSAKSMGAVNSISSFS